MPTETFSSDMEASGTPKEALGESEETERTRSLLNSESFQTALNDPEIQRQLAHAILNSEESERLLEEGPTDQDLIDLLRNTSLVTLER